MIDELLATQHGILTRAQAHTLGITDEMIEANISARRWTRRYAGVYATFSGQLPRPAELWAVVLKTGPGAVLSHETAAELVGLLRPPSATIHVTVPAGRTIRPVTGVVVHRSRRVHDRRHPALTPPQTRVEETIIDLTQSAQTLDDAIAWLARGVGARVTTGPRLSAAIDRRHRLRWREQLREAVADVAAGCHSILELRYLREVERAHGLPAAERQVRVRRGGRTVVDDVHYRRYRTRVELDGRAAHPEWDRWRDMRRDNAAAVAGDQVLRYGTADVVSHPCECAAQVSAVLTQAGWTGAPHPCPRPTCVIPAQCVDSPGPGAGLTHTLT